MGSGRLTREGDGGGKRSRSKLDDGKPGPCLFDRHGWTEYGSSATSTVLQIDTLTITVTHGECAAAARNFHFL